MPSPAPTEAAAGARWSLTSRLAWRFAAVTTALVLAYATTSLYLLYDALRADLHRFFEHETQETVHLLATTGDDRASLQAVLERVADSTREPPCAYRVRDAAGVTLAQAGQPALLEHFKTPVPVEDRPIGLSLLHQTVFGHAKVLPGSTLVVEVLVDAQQMHDALLDSLRSALLIVLVFVPLAAASGHVTARRGLSGLRDLVAQARAVELPKDGAVRLRPEDAPDELRELATEINAMLDRIEGGLATMRTFTASLAHELRSPLQNLIGETEVTLLASRPADEYVSLLRSNLDDLHELSDAVDNLVTYCRSSEPQPRAAARERFDLLAEADLRLQRERRTARRAGLLLRLAGGGDTTLRADREGVLRVLRNLVGNAMAWSPSGGAVDVHIDGLQDAVRLVVDDVGPGIPDELKDRVFEPFVSGRPRRGERGGYGLGLTICRSVVREHGGRLWHEPRDGGGTRFVAEFPKAA